MKISKTFKLDDYELRQAVKQYIERQLSDNETVDESVIRFLVTLGYNGEMGGPSTPTIVDVIGEITE